MANLDPTIRQRADVANALFEKGSFEEAFQQYRLMAEAGSIEAQLRVAWMYHTGRGVNVNLDEARRWYLRAAESNSPEAQYYLGKLYGGQKLYQEAINCLKQSAEQNYMPSIYQLGVMHEYGEGVEIDKNKAFEYYDQASRMGHLKAQRDMAVMMIKGHLGFKHIPRGIFILVRVFYSAIWLGWKDPDSDRIRW